MERLEQTNGLDFNLLWRLKEYQATLRHSSHPQHGAVPARGPLSGRDASIIERLRRQSSSLADSFEQALSDLNDHTRLTYIGPAGEVREVMRAAVQQLAPDDEVRKQPWFQGIAQGGKRNPSQAERIRYAVQQRGSNKEQSRVADELIDQLVAKVGRHAYQVGSSALHAGAAQATVRKLTGWVLSVLDEVLPD